MIIKCKGCNSALIYDIKSGRMKCEHCSTLYDLAEGEKQVEREFKVFRCTSCGARVSLHQEECATHCVYCGQPTIVFDRVSKGKRPDGIIPFLVTKEEAVLALKKRLKKGFYIPKEIKEFQLEHVTGIYLPFWIYDVKYSDNQEISFRKGMPKKREAEAIFHNFPADGATNFEDELARRLWPYDWDKVVPFEEGYLSGFCADCYDQKTEDIADRVKEECKKIFDTESLKRTKGFNKRISRTRPQFEILKERYLMLPAWCLTIRYKDKPYTMFVNGQTGAIVGAIPVNKAKVAGTFALSFVPAAAIFVYKLLAIATKAIEADALDALFFVPVLTVPLWGALMLNWETNYLKWKKHLKHATSKKTLSYGTRD